MGNKADKEMYREGDLIEVKIDSTEDMEVMNNISDNQSQSTTDGETNGEVDEVKFQIDKERASQFLNIRFGADDKNHEKYVDDNLILFHLIKEGNYYFAYRYGKKLPVYYIQAVDDKTTEFRLFREKNEGVLWYANTIHIWKDGYNYKESCFVDECYCADSSKINRSIGCAGDIYCIGTVWETLK